MSFLNIQFPTSISYGAIGGPGYSTDIVELGSGYESRNQNWSAARGAWEVAHCCDTLQKRKDVIAFFRIAKGKANSFRFQDPGDFNVATGEGVSILISGATYQLKKRYTNSAGTEDRVITLPVNPVVTQGGTPLVINTDYTIDLATGIVTALLGHTPDGWTGQFDVPARFDIDQLKLVQAESQVFRSQSIPILEDRV